MYALPIQGDTSRLGLQGGTFLHSFRHRLPYFTFGTFCGIVVARWIFSLYKGPSFSFASFLNNSLILDFYNLTRIYSNVKHRESDLPKILSVLFIRSDFGSPSPVLTHFSLPFANVVLWKLHEDGPSSVLC